MHHTARGAGAWQPARSLQHATRHAAQARAGEVGGSLVAPLAVPAHAGAVLAEIVIVVVEKWGEKIPSSFHLVNYLHTKKCDQCESQKTARAGT